MRVRLTALFLALLLVPAVAFADSHKADGAGGYVDGTGGSRLKGVQLSASLHFPPQLPHRMTLLFDYSYRSGTDNGQDVKQHAYLFGVRAMLTPPASKFKLFAQGRFGGVNTNDGVSAIHNEGAGGIGFGAEIFPTKAVPTTTGYNTQERWGVRLQVDHIWRTQRSDFTMYSAALVYRWLEPK